MLQHTILVLLTVLSSVTCLDPDSVSADDRQSWCFAQLNTCSIVCGDSTYENMCNTKTLDWSCVCEDGSDLSEEVMGQYKNSMPSSICSEEQTQCIRYGFSNPGSEDVCQSQNVQCGSKTASNLMASKTKTSSSSTGSAASSTASVTTSGLSSVSTRLSTTAHPTDADVSSSSITKSSTIRLTSTPRATDTPTPVDQPDPPSDTPEPVSPPNYTGAIAGGVIGGVAGLVLVVGSAVIFCLRRQKRHELKPVFHEVSQVK